MAKQPELILYHAWNSSASRKVRLCLAEKGLMWEGRVIDINRFQHHTTWYKRINPSGIVPALLVDDHALIESNLINEYLDEAFPNPPLMPDAPLDRHEVRRWSKFIDDTCLPAVQKPNWTLLDMTMQIERYLIKSGGPWIYGERFTLADIAAAPYVVRFEEERPGTLTPQAAAWWARFLARPCWKGAEIGAFSADNDRSVAEAVADDNA